MSLGMERVACAICGSTVADPVCPAVVLIHGPSETFNLVRCAQYNLVYLNPRPDAQRIRSYYPPQYYAETQQALDDVWANRLVRLGLKLIGGLRNPPLAVPGRLLDIGCGSGVYLSRQRNRGWDV